MGMEKLEYLLAVERTGSISKAAESLYLSQPSLSKSIASLERQIGYRVFERTSTGLRPTPEGRRYLAYARRVLELREETMEDIRQLAGKQRERRIFRLGVSTMRSTKTLSRTLLNFFNTELDTELHARIGDDATLEEAVRQGELDLATITMPLDGYFDPALRVHRLASERLLLAVSTRNPILKRCRESPDGEYPYLEPAELQGQRFILGTEGNRLREMAEVFFRAEGIEPRVSIREDYIDFALTEVELGLGVTLVNQRLAEADPREGVCYCRTAGTLPVRNVCAVWRKADDEDPEKQGLCRLFCEDWLDVDWSADDLTIY